MARESSIDPDIQDQILELVKRRIELIRDGDREGLNATYSDCLQRRNPYNSHDYDWYLSMIENGFGEPTAEIRIESLDDQPGLPVLPFDGSVSYPNPPDYKVFVETVSGRKTLWLIAFLVDYDNLDDDDDEEEQEEPRVVLPAFAGRTLDEVATGQLQLPHTQEDKTDQVAVREFHPEALVGEVISSLGLILNSWSMQLKYETIRAIAIDCAPWFGTCWVAILTTQEDFDEAEIGKWSIGDWRWNEVDEVGGKTVGLIKQYYEGETLSDLDKSSEERAEIVFEALAKSLKAKDLVEVYSRFQQADDFELGVFNMDSPEKNYCDP